jgi:hypothetical protein
MKSRHRALARLVVVAFLVVIVGCSSDSGLPEEELLSALESAGLTIRQLEPMISPYQNEKLPTEPKSMFSARVSDGHGNTEPMTFIEFSSEADARAASESQSGFALRNWFVLGIVSNHMKHHIEGAIP